MAPLEQLEQRVHAEQLEQAVQRVPRVLLALSVRLDCEEALERLEMLAIQGQLELLVLWDLLDQQGGLAHKAALAPLVLRAQQGLLGLQARLVILAPLAR